MSNEVFNSNPEYASMKQDIADRSFMLKLKGALITGGLLLLAGAALFFIPGSFGAAAPLIGVAAAMASGVAGFVTLKETEKLNMDRDFLESRMQGGNWWNGYREQVVERGGEPTPAQFSGMPSRGRASHR